MSGDSGATSHLEECRHAGTNPDTSAAVFALCSVLPSDVGCICVVSRVPSCGEAAEVQTAE